jgi:hypothetical protein
VCVDRGKMSSEMFFLDPNYRPSDEVFVLTLGHGLFDFRLPRL